MMLQTASLECGRNVTSGVFFTVRPQFLNSRFLMCA